CSDNAAEKAKLLKKTGSNLKIRNRQIEIEFRGPWKYVEKHGRLAQPNPAPVFSGAGSVGKSGDVSHQAASMGQSSNLLQGQSQHGMTLVLWHFGYPRGYPFMGIPSVFLCPLRIKGF